MRLLSSSLKTTFLHWAALSGGDYDGDLVVLLQDPLLVEYVAASLTSSNSTCQSPCFHYTETCSLIFLKVKATEHRIDHSVIEGAREWVQHILGSPDRKDFGDDRFRSNCLKTAPPYVSAAFLMILWLQVRGLYLSHPRHAHAEFAWATLQLRRAVSVAHAEIIAATRGTRLACCPSACLVVVPNDLIRCDLVFSKDGTATRAFVMLEVAAAAYDCPKKYPAAWLESLGRFLVKATATPCQHS
eukprot:4219948-Amphidinium_carterae.1